MRLARDVAEGLAAAHAAGLVHRDLKAENVVVTAEGGAKILDFGLARPILADEGGEPLTAHGAVVGTYPSMSPEQASGRDLDGRSDLFSLGGINRKTDAKRRLPMQKVSKIACDNNGGFVMRFRAKWNKGNDESKWTGWYRSISRRPWT